MNSMRYRVVFNASLATWVAVAENVAARGKPSRGRARKLVGAALSVSIAGTAMLAGAADLVRPVASTLSNQTATNIGVKSIVQSSTLTTVTQDKATAVQNWASFNVGTDHAVKFVQPDSNSRILNRIWDNDPSYINGRIDANGQVYLVNRNGIQFGKDSQINVGSLIASALNIKVKTFEDGYLSLGGKDEAAFYYAGTLDDFDAPTSDVSAVTGKDVAVRNYGSIKAADGGSIMLFAPRVENAGSIQANGGQVVLAAGAKVYLAASRDAALRGVLVEVDPFVGGNKDSSTVSNSGLKEAMQGIIADRGNITLAAMAVNNNGLLQASSGKTLNGSIYLQGRSGVTQAVVVEGTATAPAVLEPLAQQGGEVVLGANSRIEAPIDSISEADVKAQALAQYVPQAGDSAAVQASRLAALEDLIRNQYSVSRAESIASPVKSSQIRIDGRQVLLQSGSSITAPHADVSITAQGTRGVDIVRVSDDAARVVMEQGASIDVSGYQNVAVDGSRNQISATLVSNELADSPLQRDGVLYRKTVEFNLLDVPTGKMAIANASGAVDAVRLSLQEVAATGGTVSVKSQGDVVIGTGASINVSGGSVKYSDAVIETTLLTAGTQRVEIGKASADVVYSGLSTGRKTVSAYVEGKAAGTLTVAADNKMVLDGTLRGNAQAGLYQTTAQTAPKGGTLVIGDAAVAGRAISFQRGSGLGATSPFWADPLNAVVDDGSLNIVTPDIFTNGGFTQATIMATGISVAAGTPLNLLIGSTLTLSAGDITINDDIRGAGLTFKASATNLSLAAGKTIDASGMWINDALAASGRQAPYAGIRQVDGGSVNLAGTTSLNLGNGSLIDVSGGGQVTSGGTPGFGNAGSITLTHNGSASLAAGADNPEADNSSMQIAGATLRGLALSNGISAGAGGSLSITDNGIRIGGLAQADGELVLTPEQLQGGGFSNYVLTAKHGNAGVAAGTQLDLRRSVRTLGSYRNVATGGTLQSLGSSAAQPAWVKDAVSFTLKDEPSLVTLADAGGNYGVLDIGKGAVIDAGAAGAINLSATRQLNLAGTLRSQGGKVALTMSGGAGDSDIAVGYLADQSIFLTNDASIDLSGRALVNVDAKGLRTGDVLAGGSLNITASKGYIVAQQGARINVDGASAQIDQPALGKGRVLDLASNAGAVTLSGREGILFGATMSAHGGGSNAAGGSYSLTLDRAGTGKGASSDNGDIKAYPQQDRVVQVGNDLFAAGSPVGKVLSGATAGQALGSDSLSQATAWVDATALRTQGFDSVSLGSENRLNFTGATTLSATRQVAVDAPIIDVSAAQATINSNYVKLSYSGGKLTQGNASVMALKSVAAGTGTLDVNAAQIDVVGSVGITGATVKRSSGEAGTVMRSTGDLRLTGVQIRDDTSGTPIATERIEGNLTTSGDLDIQAAQIYPSTLSDFTISLAAGTPEAPSNLRISGSGGSAQVPLSAGARLALEADNIEQGGVLRAPFGTIDLNARNSLVLKAGSLTSASAEGVVIPFGELDNGTNWLYPISPDVVNADGTITKGLSKIISAVPQPTVALRGASVKQEAGSTLNVSGSGDLVAAEWVAGAGGSSDVLAQANTYAIVPGFSSAYAPYDPMYSRGFDKAAGTQITLGADAGLPAGTYTLLPARYALLPGAYKVTLLNSYKDAAPTLQLQQSLGGTVVSGRLSLANSGASDSHTQGVLVESGSVTRQRSEYIEASASKLLAANAAASDSSLAYAPGDGGHVIVAATDSIKLEGTIRMEAIKDGQPHHGSMLDISLPASGGTAGGDIVVGTSTVSDTAGVTTLKISDKDIAAIGADSVLVGGERSVSGSGTNITVTATNVRYNSADGLNAGGIKPAEVMLAASDTVSVEAGSLIQTAAPDARMLSSAQSSVSGDGALLRVAADDKSVVRTGALGLKGTLVVADGVHLDGNAVQADATLDSRIASGSAATAKTFVLGTRLINFGGGSSSTAGTDLSGNLLSSVAGSADSITLRSYQGIKFYTDLSLGSDSAPIKSLKFDAPAIEWAGTGSGAVRINALSLGIGNTTGALAPIATSGGGTLTLNAAGDGSTANGVMTLTGGDVSLRGFGATSLSADRGINFTGGGTLKAAGDVSLSAPIITAQAGANHVVHADGVLTTVRTTPSAQAGAAISAGGGAKLLLEGASIEHGGNVEIGSGDITLNANAGDVHLQAGSTLAVPSMQAGFNGSVKSTDAGTITLSSATGDVNMDSGAQIDLHGSGDASAGALNVLVPKGQARLQGTLLAGIDDAGTTAGALQGKFSLDTLTLESLDALNNLTSQFGGERSVRVRQGDMLLSARKTLKAQRVSLYADAGDIDIEGTIDASGKAGGSIDLAARRSFVTDASGAESAQGGHITLGANAVLDAHATDPGQPGGKVTLSVSADDDKVIDGVATKLGDELNIEFAQGSTVDLRGGGAAGSIAAGRAGTLTINAPRVLNLADYNPDKSGAAAVVTEASVFPGPPTIVAGYSLTPVVPVANSLYDLASVSGTTYVTTDSALPADLSSALSLKGGMFAVVVVTANNSSTMKFSVNGSPAIVIKSATGGTVSSNQMLAGRTYKLNYVASIGSPYWAVDASTPLGTASGSTILNVTASPKVGDLIYFTPQAGSFGSGTSNVGRVRISTTGLVGDSKDLVSDTGAALTAGSLVAGSSYVASYDGSQFNLLGDGGKQDVIRINDASVTSTPSIGREIVFTAAANNATSQVSLLFNGLTSSSGGVTKMPLLLASDGSPLAAGAIQAGKQYSIGRLASGDYALRPIEYENITVTASDVRLVAFSLATADISAAARDVRISVNGASAVPLVAAGGGVIDPSALKADGTLYIAHQLASGGYELVDTSGLASSMPVTNNGLNVAGSPDIVLNAVKRYTASTVDAALQAQVQTDAAQFAGRLDAIRSSFMDKLVAVDGAAPDVRVQPGVEIVSTGDMNVTADWDFAAVSGSNYLWHYTAGGVAPTSATDASAGSLSLLAGGNLILSKSLSDGFKSLGEPTSMRNNWSYQLVAGADLHAAASLTTTGDSGNLVVNNTVRTGTGNINLAAAGDINLNSALAHVYTAGERTTTATQDASVAVGGAVIKTPGYLTRDGGDVGLQAGHDILGYANDKLPTDWLWRLAPADATGGSAAWWVNFPQFTQQVGALGGGNVSLRAGNNITDAGVMLPTQGQFTRSTGSATYDGFSASNGGNLSVQAAGDIRGGQYMVEDGSAKITALGSITTGSATPGSKGQGWDIQLYAANSQFQLTSGADLSIGSVRNAGLLPQAVSSLSRVSAVSYWLGYSDSSSLDARSAAGSIRLTSALSPAAGTGYVTAPPTLITPANIQLVAPNGSVDLGNQVLYMFPSASGQLALLARDDIGMGVNGGISMLDMSAADLPVASAPDNSFTAVAARLNTDYLSNGLAVSGVRVATTKLPGALHAGDNQPALIVSSEGDVSGSYTLAKAAQISAGHDVTNLTLKVENLTVNDVSTITAGNDVVMPQQRDATTNQLVASTAGITVFGPGQMDVMAGRNVDLGTSNGVVSVGRGINSALPDTGASIRVVAGKPTDIDAGKFAAAYLSAADAPAFLALSKAAQLAFAQEALRQQFIDSYLKGDGTYLAQWQAYAAGNGVLATDPAMADPARAPAALFDQFRYRVLWAELSASGTEGSAIASDAKSNPGKYSAADLTPEKLYARGFKAIDLMGLGAPFNFNSSVRLLFSQIRTQSGGDADVLVPGGSLDIGGTQQAVGVDTSRLGLVSNQGSTHVFVRDSVNVNTSRWFAIDGGDVLGWASTGNIDAGKGSRTAISSSSQRLDVNKLTGSFTLVDGGASSGSGIATIFNRPLTTGGKVELYAPSGVINAGEAGIRAAGDLVLTANVVGADFIVSVGSSSVAAAPAAPSFVIAAPGTNNNDKAAAAEAGAPDTRKARERSSILTVEVLAAEPDGSPAAGSPACARDPEGGKKPVCN